MSARGDVLVFLSILSRICSAGVLDRKQLIWLRHSICPLFFSENLRLSSERNVLVTNSTSMVLRIKELEEQCRRLRQDLENVDLRESMYTGSVHSEDSYDDSDVSYSLSTFP